MYVLYMCNATRILLIGLRGVNMCMVEISCVDRVDIITTIHDLHYISLLLFLFLFSPTSVISYLALFPYAPYFVQFCIKVDL